MLKTCPKCNSDNLTYVEYGIGSPDHYDGISEIHCLSCRSRFGRWSEKELQRGETEKPYGRK
jgi:hypothetical protein